MKVLFITGEFPPMEGGIGDYTRTLGQTLAAGGCDVHVLTSMQASPVPGLTVHPLVEQWGWGFWRILRTLVRRERPAVVHIQYQAAAYAMHPAVNLLPRWFRAGPRSHPHRPRFAVTFHDLRVPYLFPKAGPLRRQAILELARSSDATIVTNREDYDRLSRDLSSAARPPALIPIGSAITPHLLPGYDRDAWRARYRVSPGELLICHFGFINARKGVDTLLDALHLLTTSHSDEVSVCLLMMGGRTGASDPTNVAFLERIEAQIERLDLGDRVHWTGYLPPEEVSACFAAADVCAFPFRDGASFLHSSFHTALVHGVPIVTTQPRVHLPELVDGENMLLVAREDAPALAHALLRLAGDPVLRTRLGVGAQVLSTSFRWDQIAADTLALYHDLDAGS
ncbi:MAG: glycosyltransferase family 4 protein [Anaerolineae bacterium]|nr:glycosyltransferase family 4 protein [Anaerolineae bacterium]